VGDRGYGSYGAGLARFLSERGEEIVELDRPARAPRRGGKKSDPLDAVRAAREALSRRELGEARAVGQRVALAVLLAARRSAVEAPTSAQRQLQSLVVAAPETLRARLRGLRGPQMVKRAARLRLSGDGDIETAITVEVLRTLARRVLELTREEEAHERQILAIVRAWRPDLLEQRGAGPILAATVLCAWSHAGRFRSEGAFASLGGISPIPASSGMTNRHRLNPSGDRQLNRAVHIVVINRLRCDPQSRAYAERRRAEGKSNREIKRCLKR
jgi:transposase